MIQKIIFLFLFLFSFQFIQAETTQLEPENDTLKILSWNIHMLPYFYVYTKSKKRVRAKLIIEEFKKRDYNILVLQEAFHRRIRNRIKRKLKHKYPYSYGPPNKSYFKIQTNSGLFVLSDRPLIEQKSIRFSESYSWDNKLARKGAMLLQGEFNGSIFQIIDTHTEGNPAIINNSQFHEIHEKLIRPFERENVPQIICGDFNCSNSNSRLFNQLLRILHIEDQSIQFDERKGKSNLPVENMIDHIFVRKNNSEVKVIRKRSFLIGIDWEQHPKKIFKKSVGYSDHYSVDIQLVFPEN